MPERVSHPSREQLAAFVHGQLSEEELRSLETHVANCETCCDQLRQVPHDDLVERLRDSTLRMTIPVVGDAGTDAQTQLADHPRYQIVKELGKGGMGTVYLAQHRVMGRSVALKVINPRLLRNQMAVERFRQEVQAAARLNHRNIVTAFDAEQAGDLHFLVMEYVEGTDLASTVKRHGPLPILYACNYVMQAALGLQHAHEQRMVHRDIKPQNLMRTKKGTVKILDFGLARLASPSASEVQTAGLTLEGVTLGTPDYIAPEQARDARRADIRSDIYSLGCTLYYLLTGAVPFPLGTSVEKMLAHCTDDPVPIQQLRSNLPADLIAILQKMMAKDPAARFQTPAEVAAVLKPFGQGSAPTGPVTTPPPSETPVPSTSKTRFDDTPDTNPDEDEIKFPELEPSTAMSLDLSPPGPRPGKTPQRQWPYWQIAGGSAAVIVLLLVIFNPPWGRSKDPAKGNQNLGNNSQGGPNRAPSANDWVELIPRIDAAKDAVHGEWSKVGNELHVDAAESARLGIHYSPPAEYDLEVEFTRHTGSLSIAIIFPVGSGQATYELDAWSQNLGGIQRINGRDLREQSNPYQQPLNNDQRYVARLEVRRTSVTALLDNRTIATYRGDGSDLDALHLWWRPGDARLGLGAYNAETTFHRVRIRPR